MVIDKNSNSDKIKLLSRIYMSGEDESSRKPVTNATVPNSLNGGGRSARKIKKNSAKNNNSRGSTPGYKLRFKKMKLDRTTDENLLKRKAQLKNQNEIKNKICICLSNCKYEAIRRVSRQLGFKCVKECEFWNIYWTDTILGVEFCKEMRRFQKINHFPGMFEICRKDLLARNLNRMAKAFPLDYQIFPKTWCLPADLGDAMAYSKLHRNKTFILKPDQGAQGKGISLTKSLKDIKPHERLICQLYVNKPLLIDGFKFDLRVYVLLTSTDPLRIFVYNEGLARFATSKYKEPNGHNTTNVFMHLTNYSVNRHSRTYNLDIECGSKRKFSSINRILEDDGHDISELWANIDDIIVKTILSAYPMLKHNYSACFPSHDKTQACFEILGIDILIDNKLKPYLLEVNHSPSFHTEEPIDREIKDALLKDAFNMLHITMSDKKRVLDEDRKRVKNRLLQRIKEHSKSFSERTETDATAVAELTPEEIWKEQIKWEDSHMGGYRRIMPPQNGDLNKYAAFLQMNINQTSVYSETAASKRREECGKQQRKELENRLVHAQMLATKSRPKFLSEFDEKIKMKKKRKSIDYSENSSNNSINEHDERERIRLMAQRDFLINNCGVLQTILLHFNRYNMLTSLDKRKYREAIIKLTSQTQTNEVVRPEFTPPSLTNTVNLEIESKDETFNNNSFLRNAAKLNFLPPINLEESQCLNYRGRPISKRDRPDNNTVRIQTLDSNGLWL